MADDRISRIAYVTTYDSTSPTSWSGIGYQMVEQFKAAGVQMQRVGPLGSGWRPDLRLRSLLIKTLSGKRYLRSRSPAVLKQYAQQVERQINRLKPDLILSPGTIPIAYLRPEVPLVFWTDATFDGLVDFYPSFTNLCAASMRDGHRMEQAALDACSLALYSSPWAAEIARSKYSVQGDKIDVIPFGPSLELAPTDRDMDAILQNRLEDARSQSKPIKLLFIGLDWERKGGDRAVSVLTALRQANVKAELHTVGTRLPGPMPGVRDHGFISPGTPEGRAQLAALFSTATFLLLPTQADCLPVVLTEACSFGLPILSTKVGGIPDVFTDGVEGLLFPVDSPPSAYVDAIHRLLDQPDKYLAMCRKARAAYSERLNWPHAVRTALRRLEKILA